MSTINMNFKQIPSTFMPGLQFVLIVCEGSLKLVIVFLLRMADGPQMEEEKEQTPHGLGPRRERKSPRRSKRD